jgi:hypothetical protein
LSVVLSRHSWTVGVSDGGSRRRSRIYFLSISSSWKGENVKKSQKSFLVLAMVTAFITLSAPGQVAAGDLEPPAGPTDPASAMHTIEDVFDYLDTGMPQAKRSGGFTEPVATPGSTGRTLDEIYTKITQQCITCQGTMNGTRWCDNGDGTVTDMTTGLVWLQDAAWGGTSAFWVNTVSGTNAHDRAAQLKSGIAYLSDGSVEGDWRLPTKTELYGLANGTEAVLAGSPRAFTGVQSTTVYWSSTTNGSSTGNAWNVNLNTGTVVSGSKSNSSYVWPVRSDY